MSEPLLSIVIANFNYGRFIEDAIRSVITQNCEEVELIVVDGGSTDSSVDVIKKYAVRIAWWVSEPDKGQSDAFNKGFARAKGKYLTWLNADDVLVPGCLKKIVMTLRRHPECQWFTGNFFRFDQQGRVLQIGWGPRYYPGFLQRRNSPIVSFGPTTFFSRRIYERVGKIDESLHLIMDTDLWMRFIVAGIRQRRIPCFCWGFRMHEESKTAEFGEHKLSDLMAEKMQRETAYANRKSGYRTSPLMRYLIYLWRCIDGSLVQRWYYQIAFKHFNMEVCR